MENTTKLEPNYDRRTNLCSIMRSNTIKKRTLFQNYEREYSILLIYSLLYFFFLFNLLFIAYEVYMRVDIYIYI